MDDEATAAVEDCRAEDMPMPEFIDVNEAAPEAGASTAHILRAHSCGRH
jgi:hypothetical protein